jgi:predicted CopG family antitoxin
MVKITTDNDGRIRMVVRGELRQTTKELKAISDYANSELVDKQQQQIELLQERNLELEEALDRMKETMRKQAQLGRGTVRASA